MKLVTSEGMRAIDRECIDRQGIPGLRLMENAGTGTARFIQGEIGLERDRSVVIVCGKGNNGGDGFVIARELAAAGARVSVYLAGRCDDVAGDARTNLDRYGRESVTELSEGRSVGLLVEEMAKCDLVIDAVFGTGFRGVPRGLSGTVIGQMNLCGRPILAVDVPSGLDATTGAAEGECVRASWTCTMGLPKRGFFVEPGRSLVGRLHVVDIGVPQKALDAMQIRDNVLTAPEAAVLLPPRPPDAHKGMFGRILVVAGSVGYTGAAALASEAALRSGAGLVTLATPSSLNDILEVKLTEVITKPLPETGARTIARSATPLVLDALGAADALAIGPGLSRDGETQAFVQDVVSEVAVPCVVDADGLNALTPAHIARRRGEAPLVVTPHPGEAARLLGLPVEEIQARRDETARAAAADLRATVVLKGAGTVIADPSGEAYLNPTGGSGLATGGTGDVLTGAIAALLARGMDGLHAGALGAYVHGLAGDLAAAERGSIGMIAGDVLDALPDAYREIEASGAGHPCARDEAA
jgi:hydroxyethylthiazole kinase-like uncharacterized protein yjeF